MAQLRRPAEEALRRAGSRRSRAGHLRFATPLHQAPVSCHQELEFRATCLSHPPPRHLSHVAHPRPPRRLRSSLLATLLCHSTRQAPSTAPIRLPRHRQRISLAVAASQTAKEPPHPKPNRQLLLLHGVRAVTEPRKLQSSLLSTSQLAPSSARPWTSSSNSTPTSSFSTDSKRHPLPLRPRLFLPLLSDQDPPAQL